MYSRVLIDVEFFIKLGIVLYSNNPEVVFNAFRLGLFSLEKEDEVKVFY
jgi:uncharacterized protein involved in oxidation of intracellular sulfur